MRRFIRSLHKSILEAFGNNEYFIKLEKRYPRFFNFMRNKSAFYEPYGFRFSAGIIISVVSLLYFFIVTKSVVLGSSFQEADIRIMNLISALRSISAAKFFLFFTYLGNKEIIISLAAIVLVILFLINKWSKIVLLLVSVVSCELAYTVFKLIISRPRPSVGFSLVTATGYAFPSGHAAMAMTFYGLLGYFIYQFSKQRWQKYLTVSITLLIIFFIGYSRMYLGVHWASDVLGGWLLGFSIVVLFITLYEQYERHIRNADRVSRISKQLLLIVSILLFIFEGSLIYYFYQKNPLELKLASIESTRIDISSMTDLQAVIVTDSFPKFSETLAGQKMEPVSFVIVGSDKTLTKVFQTAGWFVATAPQVKTLDRLAVSALLNRSYPTAPVTPAFMHSQPNKLAFEKATKENTVRQRHHIRFWPTSFLLQGQPVWVATASFDDGLRYWITHKIRPEIDIERDFIKNDLVNTGLIETEQQIQLVKPMMGTNQGGDTFFTDGKAYVFILKGN